MDWKKRQRWKKFMGNFSEYFFLIFPQKSKILFPGLSDFFNMLISLLKRCKKNLTPERIEPPTLRFLSTRLPSWAIPPLIFKLHQILSIWGSKLSKFHVDSEYHIGFPRKPFNFETPEKFIFESFYGFNLLSNLFTLSPSVRTTRTVFWRAWKKGDPFENRLFFSFRVDSAPFEGLGRWPLRIWQVAKINDFFSQAVCV